MEHKKNCGCGKDPCITYGAESNGANDDISIMMSIIDEIEANDIWNETINEMIRRGKAVRRPDGKVIFSDKVPQFDIIEDIAQYTTSDIKSAENSDHWMTFGRVDYNWVTDPQDMELTDENFSIIDAHIRDEVRYIIDNDNDNSSGEGNLYSGDLNITQEDEDEFTIYYYWGSPFTTGVNSAESFEAQSTFTQTQIIAKNPKKQKLNQYSKRNTSLKGADLSGYDLSGADLSDANLNGANLTNVYLGHADLTDAYLSDANLNNANLNGADLTRANLGHADLTRADLRYADLTRANMSGANLTNATLNRANMSGVKKAEDLSSFTSKELTESSSIHGDFDHASINYSGHQNLIARAESQSMGCNKCGDKYPVLDYNCHNCSGCSGCCECASGPQMMGLDAEENIAIADPSFWMNYPITGMLATAGIFAIGKTLLNSRKGE